MDAAADARTAELHRLLMRPFGSRTLSVLPVRGPAGVSGALLLEDAAEPERARSFAQAVSSIAAMRMARHEQEDHALMPHDMAEAGPAEAAPYQADRALASSSVLTQERTATDGLAATFFPSVTAMSIRFDDAVALGRPDQAGVTTLADEIAKAMQAIASQYAAALHEIDRP